MNRCKVPVPEATVKHGSSAGLSRRRRRPAHRPAGRRGPCSSGTLGALTLALIPISGSRSAPRQAMPAARRPRRWPSAIPARSGPNAWHCHWSTGTSASTASGEACSQPNAPSCAVGLPQTTTDSPLRRCIPWSLCQRGDDEPETGGQPSRTGRTGQPPTAADLPGLRAGAPARPAACSASVTSAQNRAPTLWWPTRPWKSCRAPRCHSGATMAKELDLDAVLAPGPRSRCG